MTSISDQVRGPERVHPVLRGLIVTCLCIAAIEVAARLGYRLPSPTALFLLILAYATFVAGMAAGMVSLLIAMAYALHYIGAEGFTGTNLWRLGMFAVSAPAMVLLVGVLRRRAQRVSNERLRLERDYAAALVASLQDGLIARDAHGRIIEVNDSFCQMMGYSRQELVGQKAPYSYWPEEEIHRIRQVYERYMSGETAEYEVVFKRRNGERVPVLLSASPLRLLGGSARGFVATVKDITERKQAEATNARLLKVLQQQRERMDQLLANVPGVVWEAYGEPDGARQRIDFVSRHVEKMLGYTVEEWLNTPNFWITIVHPDDRSRAAEESAQLFASGGGVSEFRWLSRDGRVLWVEAQSTVIYDDNGQPIGMRGVTLDISRRKQAEVALRERAQEMSRLAAELEKRNQELDQFAYVASHDLKAPLRGIANLSQWMEEDLGDKLPPESRKQMDLLRGRVHRMESLIDGILQYSRIGRIQMRPEPVDVSRLLADVVELLDPPSRFTIEVQPGMPTLTTEKLRLQQVFMNLIGNAIKHHDRPEGRVTVSVREAGEFYEFSVADDGPGIAPQYHEKIFVIFQTLQARDTVEGTGLGLSLVRKIVEHVGGKVSLDSAEDRGSVFRFTWPRNANGK